MELQMERPKAIWWLLIVPPMTRLAVLSVSAQSVVWWQTWSHLPLSQVVYQWIFALATVTHVGEATYAWRLASRGPQAPLRIALALQTFALGYPSLRLLRARVRLV